MTDHNFIYAMKNAKSFFPLRKIFQKILTKEENSICYLSLNKTAGSILKFIDENKINSKIFIIDLISKRFFEPIKREGVEFQPPSNLSLILKKIIKIVEREKSQEIILDSLSIFEEYYDEKDIEEFIKDLILFTESKNIILQLIISFEDLEKTWINSIISRVGKAKKILC